MTTKTRFHNVLKAELFKLKGTFVMRFCMLSAFLMPTIFFCYYLFYQTRMVAENAKIDNPWTILFKKNNESIMGLLIPIFAVLLVSFYMQIDKKDNLDKLVFTMPLTKWSLFFSQFLAIIVLFFSTYLIYTIAILFYGYILGIINSEFGFVKHLPDLKFHFTAILRSSLLLLGMIAIQFWLSFRLKNILIPITLGIVLIILGLFTLSTDLGIYFPYAYGLLSLKLDDMFDAPMIVSLLLLLLIIPFGYLDINRLDVKN